jgi:hypothetical protein
VELDGPRTGNLKEPDDIREIAEVPDLTVPGGTALGPR